MKVLWKPSYLILATVLVLVAVQTSACISLERSVLQPDQPSDQLQPSPTAETVLEPEESPLPSQTETPTNPPRAAEITPTISPPSTAPQSTAQATPKGGLEDVLRSELARLLNQPAETLQIGALEAVVWPDACLGADFAQPGEACVQGSTPGWVGMVQAGDLQFEFRLSAANQSVLRLIPGPALAARQALVGQTGLPPLEIRFLEIEPVEWPDGCLGVYQPDMMCTMAIVPGYRVVLEAGGQTYEYHTDLSGRQVILANAPRVQIDQPALLWSWEHDRQCDSAEISLDEVIFSACNGTPVIGHFVSTNRQADLKEFIDRYAPFEANTPAGKLLFNGQGQVLATPAEQRQLAEWARLVAQEAQARRSGAAWGLVMAWQRQGGLAGFCESLAIYVTGEALGSDCRSGQPNNMQRVRLTASQLKALYDWMDTYQYFDQEQTDPAVADSMSVRLTLNGNGEQSVDDYARQMMILLSTQLSSRLSTPQDDVRIQAALATLKAYFTALTTCNYKETAKLYGGSYDLLAEMNPDLRSDDLNGLWQAYCNRNGGVCNLSIRQVVHKNQISPDAFRFTVELQSPDGSPFHRGPCCGEDPATNPPESQFEFTVKQQGERYQVMDLPVYVP